MGVLVLKHYMFRRGFVWKCEHVLWTPCFFSPLGDASGAEGEWPYTEATPSGAAPTSPPEGVFRHKRLMDSDGASRALGAHHGPTRIHFTDYSLRHRRDGNAGTTILYHLCISHRHYSSSGMTAGRQKLLGMGTVAASAGAAGLSEGLRAGWSSGRTEAGVHRAERTTHLRERADDRDSEPDYLLRLTRHGPGDY